MSTFYINGNQVTVSESKKLLPYLRDELRLTSVKNGCSEGACGTCMILLDGKAVKACIQRTDRLEGKSVVTMEGLSARERDVYAYAFSKCGAVQCGFCTPGMVISAKGLIDQNPEPTLQQVKEALKANICRCTGYKKIEEAVLLSARMLRQNEPVPQESSAGNVGESILRVDARGKALGESGYADDLYFDGMIYGSAVRSQYPRAKVLSIDASEAKALPGVLGVFTSGDLPGEKKVGHLRKDWDVLIPIGSVTHYLGDAIALVAAETPDILEQAKALVKVTYEELTPVLSAEEALRQDAPLIHETGNLLAEVRLNRGNAAEKIKNSEYVVTNRYSVPPTEHAFLEPECAVALLEDDGLRIYSADQGIYQTQHECADASGLPLEKVRVTAMMVGGGFGGKEDMTVQHHAAVLAVLLKRPVKVRLSRQESILVHPKRHPMDMEFTSACDENGILTALKATLIADSGAYASLGGPVLQRACTHAAGPYNYQDIDIVGKALYTNNPPCGAFRGFGVTQSCFAMESNLNELAKLAGISPFEIRYRNAIRPGQVLPNGQIADSTTALVETLDAVRADYEANPSCGIACAMKNSGLGVGVPDTGRVRISVIDGKAHLRSSAACIGQGMGTVQLQMVCDETGLDPSLVVYDAPDTSYAPNSGNTTASRQTLFTGEAAVRAARALKEALKEAGSLEALNGRDFSGEYFGATDPFASDKANPISHIAYGYATHLVELDESGLLKRVVAAHDVGVAVNPVALEGQIEGGVVMSLGYALTEDFPLQNGKPMAKFGTLGLFKSTMTPPVEARVIGRAGKDGLAKGAKGIGEIASIPTPPAVALAYQNRDGIFRTKLPLAQTPYKK